MVLLANHNAALSSGECIRLFCHSGRDNLAFGGSKIVLVLDILLLSPCKLI
jgi:hypothetical protein